MTPGRPRGTDVLAPYDDVVPGALVRTYIGATGLLTPPFTAVAG